MDVKALEEPRRYALRARFDLLPGEGLRWAARAMAYGWEARGGKADWRAYPETGDKSPLNHAMGHLTEAVDLPVGDRRRVWKLAKAAANLLMAVWLESSGEAVEWWENEKWLEAVRKGERARAESADGGEG